MLIIDNINNQKRNIATVYKHVVTTYKIADLKEKPITEKDDGYKLPILCNKRYIYNSFKKCMVDRDDLTSQYYLDDEMNKSLGQMIVYRGPIYNVTRTNNLYFVHFKFDFKSGFVTKELPWKTVFLCPDGDHNKFYAYDEESDEYMMYSIQVTREQMDKLNHPKIKGPKLGKSHVLLMSFNSFVYGNTLYQIDRDDYAKQEVKKLKQLTFSAINPRKYFHLFGDAYLCFDTAFKFAMVHLSELFFKSNYQLNYHELTQNPVQLDATTQVFMFYRGNLVIYNYKNIASIDFNNPSEVVSNIRRDFERLMSNERIQMEDNRIEDKLKMSTDAFLLLANDVNEAFLKLEESTQYAGLNDLTSLRDKLNKNNELIKEAMVKIKRMIDHISGTLNTVRDGFREVYVR